MHFEPRVLTYLLVSLQSVVATQAAEHCDAASRVALEPRVHFEPRALTYFPQPSASRCNADSGTPPGRAAAAPVVFGASSAF